MFKDYHTLLTRRLDYLAEDAAEFQDEMIGTFEQGQGVISNISVEIKFI